MDDSRGTGFARRDEVLGAEVGLVDASRGEEGAVYDATRCLTEMGLPELGAPTRLVVADAGPVGIGVGTLRFEAARDICEADRLGAAAIDACEAGRDITVLASLRFPAPARTDVCKNARPLAEDAGGRDTCLALVTEGCFAVVEDFVGGTICRIGGLLGFSNSFCGTSRAA